MPEGTELAAEFADLARRLQATAEEDVTLEEVLRAAVATVRADIGGVMLVRKGKVESAAVTGELVQAADDLQISCGDGPCLEALEESDTFIIADTVTEKRWPRWCASVVELGVRSVLSIRLSVPAGVTGALNMYALEPGRFTRDDAELGSILATHASLALAHGKERSELRQAIDGRHVIGMAQGILMERFSLRENQAFAVLRRYSQDRNIKLRDVAQHVVSARTLPA